MRVIFVASGPVEWGSSRMRCYWVAPYMEDATVVQYGKGALPVDADVYIWQKQADIGVIDSLYNARHYWDVCDPMWWFSPQECVEIATRMDGVAASNEALLADYDNWRKGKTPRQQAQRTIPDRMELSHFDKQREHADVTPVRFVWYGVAQNRIALHASWANLERLAASGYDISLTIMDNRPDVHNFESDNFPVLYAKWDLQREVGAITIHDVALLPPYPGPWGKVKSDNKVRTAHLCNLVATPGTDYDNLEALMSEGARYPLFDRDEYDVRRSASEWEAFLADDYPD